MLLIKFEFLIDFKCWDKGCLKVWIDGMERLGSVEIMFFLLMDFLFLIYWNNDMILRMFYYFLRIFWIS